MFPNRCNYKRLFLLFKRKKNGGKGEPTNETKQKNATQNLEKLENCVYGVFYSLITIQNWVIHQRIQILKGNLKTPLIIEKKLKFF